MESAKSEKLDIIADGLDDLRTTLDELQDSLTTPEEVDALGRLRGALEDASDAADRLENLNKDS